MLWSIVVNSSSIETIVSFVRIGISILKASIDDEIYFKCLYSLGSIGSKALQLNISFAILSISLMFLITIYLLLESNNYP